MKKSAHFKALINYRNSEEGGLVSPVSSGFRATFQFPFELQTYFGSQTFEEPEHIFAGDSVTVEVTLINAENFTDKLYSGMEFEISDNSGIIGHGVIADVYKK